MPQRPLKLVNLELNRPTVPLALSLLEDALRLARHLEEGFELIEIHKQVSGVCLQDSGYVDIGESIHQGCPGAGPESGPFRA